MQNIVALNEFEQDLHAIWEGVLANQTYVVTSEAQPQAVLLPYDLFLHLQQGREGAILARFDHHLMARMAHHNRDVVEDELTADIEAARDEL